MRSALRIGFQGVAGAFSESAVRHWWPEGQAIGFVAFADVVAALLDGHVDHAVLPVENLIAGQVVASLEAIATAGSAVRIVDTMALPIELCLLALPGTTVDRITTVMSHPVALAQCGPFLASLGALVVEHADTAGAAQAVREAGDLTTAAVASALAAERYGLVVLARGVQARADNWTRFVRVDREPGRPDPDSVR
jgi:prephenate dehydratase